MGIDAALRLSLTRFAIAAGVAALTPVAAHAQSGILHKRTYAPGAIVTLPAPAEGIPGAAHGHAMGAGPTFRPHGREGFKGGASVSLPAAADGSNDVRAVSFAATPAGGRPESAAAMGEMTRATRAGGGLLSQPPANGLHKHALGVHASGNAAPAAEAAASPNSAVARGGVMAGVKPVAVERSAASLRWVDRLRFSWPGSGN